MTSYNGQCACGKVQFQVTEPFMFTAVCHCQQCRDLIGQPFAFVSGLEKTEQFKVTKGEDQLETYEFCDTASRCFCKACGTTVVKKRKAGSVIVYPSLFRGIVKDNKLPEQFKPSLHVFYKDRIMDLKDGTPKFEGMPDTKQMEE